MLLSILDCGVLARCQSRSCWGRWGGHTEIVDILAVDDAALALQDVLGTHCSRFFVVIDDCYIGWLLGEELSQVATRIIGL